MAKERFSHVTGRQGELSQPYENLQKQTIYLSFLDISEYDIKGGEILELTAVATEFQSFKI